jgi:hypothetical protein
MDLFFENKSSLGLTVSLNTCLKSRYQLWTPAKITWVSSKCVALALNLGLVFPSVVSGHCWLKICLLLCSQGELESSLIHDFNSNRVTSNLLKEIKSGVHNIMKIAHAIIFGLSFWIHWISSWKEECSSSAISPASRYDKIFSCSTKRFQFSWIGLIGQLE